MGKLMTALMAGFVAMVLAGCGQTPASAPTGAYKASTSRTAAKSATPVKKAPSVSSKPATSTPAKPGNTAKPAETAAPAAPAADPEVGSLKVDLKVTGNAPVASVMLKVFEQTDPAVSVEVPVTLTNGVATWKQAEVAPGRYTLQVQALDAAKKVLGAGNGEAIVTAGKATEVALELRANVLSTTDTTSGTTPTTPSQIGGTIGLNIEIF